MMLITATCIPPSGNYSHVQGKSNKTGLTDLSVTTISIRVSFQSKLPAWVSISWLQTVQIKQSVKQSNIADCKSSVQLSAIWLWFSYLSVRVL